MPVIHTSYIIPNIDWILNEGLIVITEARKSIDLYGLTKDVRYPGFNTKHAYKCILR